jgi:hypothetical protein
MFLKYFLITISVYCLMDALYRFLNNSAGLLKGFIAKEPRMLVGFLSALIILFYMNLIKKRPQKVSCENLSKNTKTPEIEMKNEVNDPYIQNLSALKDLMIQYTDLELEKEGDSEVWKQVSASQKNNFSISVQKRVGQELFFRCVVDFESCPATTFDFIADITKRPSWDDICVKTGLVQRVSHQTAIYYMQTKGLWPSAPREALFMNFVARLEDGRYMNVTKSIKDHPNFQPESSHVRMTAFISGMIVGPHPSGDPKRARCIQVLHGDLGGWLPGSVVQMVTTQSFPISMRKLNSLLKNSEIKTESVLIEQSEGTGKLPVIEETVVGKEEKKVVKSESFLVVILKILRQAEPLMVFAILLIALFRRK